MDIGVNVHLPAARANKRVPLDRYTKYKFGLRILKWYHRGHLLGPFDEDDEILDDVREAPVFAVDRADGGKRPVSDASQRLDDGGPSVNEHIKEFAPEKATVEYLHLQQILVTITLVWIMYGTTVQIWAKDLEEGYYNMRVRRDQVRLTAFVFCGLWFLPMTLSMGLSSAPFIFTVFMGYVVEAMLYDDQDTNYLVLPDSVLVHFRHHFPEGVIERVSATHSRIPLILYYLDDMFGIQTAKRIWRQFRGAQRVLLSLSLNAQESKDRKPANYQLILGIGIECRLRFVIIWRPKGEDYVDFAYFLLTLPSLEKRKLFSLSGKARHLALHIPPLAAFARGLEVFGLKDRNGKSIGWRHHIHWNQHIRRAIRILIAAITLAMDIPVPFDRVLRPRSFDDADIELYTDAAGVYGGIGGFVAENGSMFFQVSWDGIPLQPYHDIMWKEMVEGVIERVSATHSRIPLILYYLDDMFGIQTAKRIWRQFRGAQRVLLSLSLNAQESKDRKPANYQLILGIGIECRLRFVIIWRPKGEDYVDFAYFLLTLPSLEKRKLFSLSGKARHLALHIPPLAAFARGLEVFGLKDRNGKSIGWRHHIHWNQHIRRAIRILIAAITLAMDIPVPFDRVLRPRSFDDADIELYTDAAGVYGGIGGFVAENGSMFFQVSWDGIPLQPYHDIMWKEMVAVWILLRLAVDRCRGLNVGCVCDNQSVVAMLFKYRPPISRPDLFWIVLQVAELCLQHQIWPYFHWIKGTENVTADRLSRFSPQPFEHCTTSNLKSVNSEAADLLRFAAAETSNLVVDLDECVFTDDDDDDDGDDDDANSADIPKPRQN